VKPALVGDAWDVPVGFNFTRDVIEATAAQSSMQRALAYVDSVDVVRRLTYAELAVLSAHWANLLEDVGLRRGERLLVLVGKKPEWHAILLGALRLGVISVPCPELRGDAISRSAPRTRARGC
jgi:acyl-coenzyme A synthetase/AMP-(fatty) acid ligase